MNSKAANESFVRILKTILIGFPLLIVLSILVYYIVPVVTGKPMDYGVALVFSFPVALVIFVLIVIASTLIAFLKGAAITFVFPSVYVGARGGKVLYPEKSNKKGFGKLKFTIMRIYTLLFTAFIICAALYFLIHFYNIFSNYSPR